MQAMKIARPTTISAELILQITLPLLLPPHADNDGHDDLRLVFNQRQLKHSHYYLYYLLMSVISGILIDLSVACKVVDHFEDYDYDLTVDNDDNQ